MANISTLWSSPEINPVNRKARSLPVLNPINTYGRVFFFSWFGFFLAFWSWYAFPPLLSSVIAGDLKISKNVVANSNVIALTATLLVRLVSGPCCDRFGPRLTFAACLLAGAIPTFLAGTVKSAAGLYAIRFFVGILGGSFVPCQVWTTAFFDKNIVGTANGLAAGLGNSGGGITYFLMPAIYNSLRKHQGLSTHVAWRVSFVVPGILITFTAVAMVLCCPDTPVGKWADRVQVTESALQAHDAEGCNAAAADDGYTDPTENQPLHYVENNISGNIEACPSEKEASDTARGEVIQTPTWGEVTRVVFSASTAVVAVCYFCTFGTELAVNSILGSYYKKNFAPISLQDSGNYAAIFGILNAVMRPIGGALSDFAYRKNNSLWSKKVLLHAYCVMTGVFCILIGVMNPKERSTLFGLISGGLAFFLEGANGMNYSLVPHVHPYANGIVSGVTAAAGNLGGIVFAIIFRYHGQDYAKAFWIIGVIVVGLQVVVFWIRPVPRGQVGGK